MALRGITPSLSVRRGGLFFKHAGRVELSMGRNKEINKSMHNSHKKKTKRGAWWLFDCEHHKKGNY